ncbi:TRAP transporter substrate-binding protein [Ideonella sp. BN130291]|uniref:TRAP transporter substrate-binding protein n=1 Tax=Ideonella sp. BN130291 TaxID=3112940 RepID=UPI002E2763BE|nr:TRAP transporter substrate-binding protein [Ideonella sp. BN130291]
MAAAPGVQAQSAAPAAPVRIRIVGGLANVNQYTRHEEPFWTTEIPRLSGGKLSAEIVPFDRAGLRAQEVLRLVQLGAVPFATLLLSVSAGEDPELGMPDLAGLNTDMPAARRSMAAARPYLEKVLRERYGVELLATYVYPAQVMFCTKPFTGLSDLKGRRIRTSSPAQSDLVEALGATPVQTGFAEILPNVKSGNVDCAITGAMSGNTIGLHEATTHLHTMAINWGPSAFVANAAAWKALPPDMQALIKRELPGLERSIWNESERETLEGIACNSGGEPCTAGRKGRMTVVRASAADERRRREIFASTVLPRWVQRCGNTCAAVWNQTIGPVAGFEAHTR